jgi:hypothetical protein
MTEEAFAQIELVQGTTHWIAWFSATQLSKWLKEGWSVLHAYPGVLTFEKLTDGKTVLTQFEMSDYRGARMQFTALAALVSSP